MTSIITLVDLQLALAYKADLLKANKMLSTIPCFVLSSATNYMKQNGLTQAIGRSA